jgi:hypothetical protein
MVSLIPDEGAESGEYVEAMRALYPEFLSALADALAVLVETNERRNGTSKQSLRELLRVVFLARRVLGNASSDLMNMMDDGDVESAQEIVGALYDFFATFRRDEVERVLLRAIMGEAHT